MSERAPLGIAGRVAKAFLHSKLIPLASVASLALGVLGMLSTPREEEPQISVPMIDVIVAMPGEQINATRAQQRASDLALTAVQERYRVGAATLVELTVARAAQVTAASALVNARYSLIIQQSLTSFFTGTLDPATISFGSA